MKLSEVRPCDRCNGAFAGGQFYVIRVSLAFVSPKALRQVHGLSTMLGGHLPLAEVMAPDVEVIKVAGEEEPSLWTDLLICSDCFMAQAIDLPILMEKVNAAKKA